ncbi:MAG: type III-A CRISPR-associated RAMP protein Csm5 [Sarcina sp.]|nr:type III-A CRISPR-associated RAMP protein Csm5 [Sarcina sp.]
MDDFIKRGFIEFKTLAPVYIGCGRTVSKKEYLYDPKTRKIEILQMNKVFDKICRLGLEKEFESYLLSPGGNNKWNKGRELIDFMKDNNIPESEYSTWSDEVMPFADSDMSYRSIKNINLFIRDERGLPYVPGSSFKGMLRTILETEYYLENRDQAAELAERITDKVQGNAFRPKRREWFLKEEDAEADVSSMHKEMFEPQKSNEPPGKNLRNQKNDTLRGLLIGDSEAISWEDMCICEKIDVNIFGKHKNPGSYREAIKPGVIIKIPISIDTRICSYTIRDILDAIKSFNMNYISQFTQNFPAAPATGGNSTTFFLGGGTGYVSKTITYGVMRGSKAVETVAKIINETLPHGVRQKHGHINDINQNVSPHMLKCTRYNGILVQMGACHVIRYY